MPPATVQIPEVGQAVRVRNRLATVRAVEPYDSRDAQGRLHVVDVEYLDDCRFPEAEQLLWEVEPVAEQFDDGGILVPGAVNAGQVGLLSHKPQPPSHVPAHRPRWKLGRRCGRRAYGTTGGDAHTLLPGTPAVLRTAYPLPPEHRRTAIGSG
jgi:hypothetical protein